MALLIVGGDIPESFAKELEQAGIGRVLHWDGRKTRHCSAPLPQEVQAVLVLTDAVAHDVLVAVKQRAARNRVPLFFGRRSRRSVRVSVARVLQITLPSTVARAKTARSSPESPRYTGDPMLTQHRFPLCSFSPPSVWPGSKETQH